MKDKYAVLGNPIAHSKSPVIYTEFAAQNHQDMTYEAVLVPLDDFAGTVRNLVSQGYKGFNITTPFKQQAFEIADTVSPQAQLAQAANFLAVLPNGQLHADTADGIGLWRDLQHNLHFPITDSRILIFGAGGAVASILEPLLNSSPEVVIVANRTFERAEKLTQHFAHLGNIHASSLDGITDLLAALFPKEITSEFDLVINAISNRDATFAFPAVKLAKTAGCYDLAYGKPVNTFVQWGIAHGAAWAVDGIGMLVEQAAESFHKWRGIFPETSKLIKQLQTSK
jgi:shikimate dehydrogenase